MIQLNFKVFGEGKPLLILHGLFGSLDNWQTIAKHTASLGFKTYIIDQRNHGKSPHVASHTYTDMANDLNDFMIQEKIEKGYLVGHSMGGKAVMQFAALYPEKIEKLVVVDIGPKYYPPHHQEVLHALHSFDFSKVNDRKSAEEEMSLYIKEEGVKQFLLKNLERKSATEFQWKMNLSLLSKDIENIGAEITLPKPFETKTLFIAGANSSYVLKEDREGIKKQFPTAQVVYIANAGHWIHAEQPENFTAILLNFLQHG